MPTPKNNLKAIMQAKLATVRWLVTASGVPETTIRSAAFGMRTPKPEARAAIAKALGVPEKKIWPKT